MHVRHITNGKITICIAILLIAAVGAASALTPQEQLGKNLFADKSLSEPAGQSCQDCHVPAVAFTEPDKNRSVSEGATPGRFGNRNAPSAAYASFSPQFSFEGGVVFRGGQFWDGRAANQTEQAKAPFLNPLEMNNTDEIMVLNKINASTNASLFNTVCGQPDVTNQTDVESKYTCMTDAIAAFEKTAELNKFNSKFDLTVQLNNPADLTAQEFRGLQLFRGKAKCNVCHAEPFFTDFDYENIGVPSNLGMLGNTPALQSYFPFYYPPLATEFNPAGLNFTDPGLAANPAVPDNLKQESRGKMKAPSLRNVNLTAPYMHNGVFRTLKEVVHFYNTRDALGNCASTAGAQPGVNCWPASEVLENRNVIIGNLQLTDAEENDVVEFLKTLTDDFNLSLIPPGPTNQEQLGKLLFTDINLSEPAGQSCQDCHDPTAGFAESEKTHGVSPGVIPGRFGKRNAPSAAYASFSPEFSSVGGLFTGGQFWDGRAANLTEQAKRPFLGSLEMNNTNEIMVLNKINTSANANLTSLFNQVCGVPDLLNQTDVESKYTCMASAIAAFERTAELNNFSSKFDLAPTGLSIQESRGRGLFNGKAGCVECHPDPIFTVFGYENIGVPSNLGMLGNTTALQSYFPFYYPPLAPEFNPDGLFFVDTGLAVNPGVPVDQKQLARGKMKIPTLRNVGKTSPYMHNGVFNDLKTVVHFYNTRDILPICASGGQPGVNCWPAPEVFENLNRRGIGNLGLTDAEENDIVAFLKTLTDGFLLPPPAEIIAAQEELGKFLFTDSSLSTPEGQSCQNCHVPAFAFTEPDKTRGVSEGIIPGRFGNRNAPSTAYAAFSSDFGLARAKGNLIFAGGMFWDGRAGNMIEQAKGPFLNSLEMNNPSKEAVLNKIQAAPYAPLFNMVCGDRLDVESKYTCVAEAIVSFERTKEMNKFNSKFDLNNLTGLTAQERSGFALFTGKARCFLCHPTVSEAFAQPLFTDFDYENIGVPSNLGMMGNSSALRNYFPFYYELEFNSAGLNFVDIGLAANPGIPDLLKPTMRGLMKAPTLRNVEITAPYMHNGVFKDLKTVVHFYNTRDTLGNCLNTQVPQPSVNCWPSPEVLANLNPDIGNLQLTPAEEDDIVAFLKTLTDVTANNTYEILLNQVVPIVNNTLIVTVRNNTLAAPEVDVTFILNDTTPILKTTGINGEVNFTPLIPGILKIQATKGGVPLVNRSVSVVAVQFTVVPGTGAGTDTGGSSGGSAPDGGSSGGGGGGGGGGGSGESLTNIHVREVYDLEIFKDRTTSYRFTDKKNPVMFINITGNKNAGVITVQVEALKGKSGFVTTGAPGIVYMNFNGLVGTKGFPTPANIKEASITFKVENIWLSANGVLAGEVKLVKWIAGEWKTLETRETGKDDTYTYFTGMTDSFSSFAITVLKPVEGVQAAGLPPAAAVTPPAPGETQGKAAAPGPKGAPGFEIALVIAAILAMNVLGRKIRR